MKGAGIEPATSSTKVLITLRKRSLILIDSSARSRVLDSYSIYSAIQISACQIDSHDEMKDRGIEIVR